MKLSKGEALKLAGLALKEAEADLWMELNHPPKHGSHITVALTKLDRARELMVAAQGPTE